MSSSPAIGDSGRFSSHKMTFSQTCNLLSQYVKEKRALGPTMSLFPVTGKPAEETSGLIGKTINLFPQISGFNPSLQKDQAIVEGNTCVSKAANTEPPAAQMTIFYGGQVVVFNDLPGDKAKEVMDLASSFELSQKKRKLEPTKLAPPSSVPISISITNPKPSSNPNSNVAPSFVNNVIPASVPRPPVANVSDLPIARKASLHRFLEKRKDRLVGKAPATVNISSGGSSTPVESKSWLGLGSLPVFQPQQQL